MYFRREREFYQQQSVPHDGTNDRQTRKRREKRKSVFSYGRSNELFGRATAGRPRKPTTGLLSLVTRISRESYARSLDYSGQLYGFGRIDFV